MAYVAIFVGILILVAVPWAWRSESFFDYVYEMRESSRIGPKPTREQAGIAIRCVLVMTAFVGGVVVLAAAYSIA